MNADEVMVEYKLSDVIKSIRDEGKAQQKILNEILSHQKITNGRVTRLERSSIGNWVKNNTLKAIVFGMMIITMLVSDIRHPLIKGLISLIGLI